MNVKIYTTKICPYCIRAKMLLKKKNITFEEVNVGNDPQMRMKLVEMTGMRTVPQIFFDNRSIGGFTELQALDHSGELDKIIQAS
ncbi:MAG: glutaredoxin 3 [Acidobacteria bacterium]|nr:MAG: glutaredoxin 3 [Acidobacteriota bacterium]